jgi:cytochrome P450
LAYRRAPFDFVERCEREHYGIAELRFVHRVNYVVTDPSMLEQIFVTQNKAFQKGFGHKETRPLFGDGLLTSDGATWRAHRKVLNPFFHPSKTDAYGGSIEATTREHLSEWRHHETRNVYRDMNRLCLEVLFCSLFGRSFAHAFETVGRAALALHQSHNRWTYGSGEFRAAVRELDAFLHDLIEHYQADAEQGSDVVSTLLREHRRNPSGLTFAQVRDHVATTILAGFETTASAITWTLYLLARHPVILRELQAELDELRQRKAFSDASMAELPSLTQVLCESLRLYPPAHRLTRRAIEPVTLGDYELPAGTELLIPVWAVHRSARHYAQPHTFLPSRWTPELRASLPRFAYFPFGGGPRTCIGQSMAVREMSVIVATIASSFDLAPAFAGERLPYHGITLLPDGADMPLIVRARAAKTQTARRSSAF